jgi:hypothetical protein
VGELDRAGVGELLRPLDREGAREAYTEAARGTASTPEQRYLEEQARHSGG